MSRIFISHSSADVEATERLRVWISEEQGFESYFVDSDPDRGLVAARSWEEQLLSKLRFCRLFVAVVTERWLASRWCFAEYTHARLRGKPIFLVKHDTCELPPEMSTDQYVDLAADRAGGLQRLARGLQEADADPRSQFALAPDRPLYPGLVSFEEEDAAVFFGRDEAVDACLGRLEGLALTGGLLLVLGPSGSGKSSLLKAGALPLLRRQPQRWAVAATITPGPDPLSALAFSIASVLEPDDASARRAAQADLGRELLEAGPDPRARAQVLAARIGRWRALHADTNVRVVLPIDQLEEGLQADQQLVGEASVSFDTDRPAEGDRFVEVLGHLLTERIGVVAVATMRSDQLAAYQRQSGASNLHPQTFLVDVLDRAALFQVIEGPAERAEIELEPGLAGRMVEDAGSGDALPLLAFTLQQLYRRHGAERRLEIADYERLGGVSGAVETHASGLLTSLDVASQQRDVRAAFLALVQLDEDGHARRRAARWDELPEPAAALLERFVDARILVRKQDTIEVAHEAIFECWPPLRSWIDEAQGALRTLRQVRSAADEWAQHDRPERLRWSDERAVEAIEAYENLHTAPSPGTAEHDFLRPLTRQAMYRDLEEPNTTHEDRASIGVRLALLGDERDGIGWAEHGPDLVWCDVPPGVLRLHDPSLIPSDAVAESREAGWLTTPEPRGLPDDGQLVEVVPGLQVTRYPITWAQFRPFLEERDGFTNATWWPWVDIDEEPIAVPARHSDNHPASGLSWYTAVAYSRWLSHRLGSEMRLPTEWEWQQAATGGDLTGRRYPWGPDWDPDRTNTWESGLRRTTAVGMYPQAAAPTGAMDMAGNAWEWCLNTYVQPSTEPDVHAAGTRVLKGASCIVDGRKNSRTDYTGKLDPSGRYVTCFRLARVVTA